MGDLIARQQARSLHAILDVEIEPETDGGVRVTFEAVPGNFCPRSFDGVICHLVLMDGSGESRVQGHLRELEFVGSRGMHFGFRFEPDMRDAHLFVCIRFHGQLHFSNVRGIRIETPGYAREVPNLFFRGTEDASLPV